MEIPRSVVAHVLGGIISARPVRKICPHCIQQHTPEERELALLGDYLPAGTIFYHGVGCAECNNSGYFGTTGLYEIIKLDHELRSAIVEGANSFELDRILKAKNIMSLFQSALIKAASGIITPSEVIRVTGGVAK